MASTRDIRTNQVDISCDVCGRTLLRGERAESYLAGGERRQVCELCTVRAQHEGWIREDGGEELTVRSSRTEPQAEQFEEPPDQTEPAPEPETPRPQEAPPRARRQDPRHVRAVPTNAEVKIERALELFNASEHQRTVAGLSRSLGAPYAAAQPDHDTPSTVNLVVAWELSWYRFKIDLGDANDPVGLAAKGDELNDIEEELRNWNAGLDAEGRLVIGVAQQ